MFLLYSPPTSYKECEICPKELNFTAFRYAPCFTEAQPYVHVGRSRLSPLTHERCEIKLKTYW